VVAPSRLALAHIVAATRRLAGNATLGIGIGIVVRMPPVPAVRAARPTKR
jgi:hypothetical protein